MFLTEWDQEKVRGNFDEFATCKNLIKHEDMKEFYKLIYAQTQGD